MNLSDGPMPPGAAEPLDALDGAIFEGIRELFESADPMPDDLVDRVQFALALENFDIDVFCPQRCDDRLVGVRGDEETRTITFDSESLTIMISISPAGGETVRLDGWLAPPASHRIELRTDGGRLVTTADAGGRFSLDAVPHGLAQLVVHPNGNGSARSIVTPSIVM